MCCSRRIISISNLARLSALTSTFGFASSAIVVEEEEEEEGFFCCPEAEATNVDSFLLIVACFPSTVDDVSVEDEDAPPAAANPRYC